MISKLTPAFFLLAAILTPAHAQSDPDAVWAAQQMKLQDAIEMAAGSTRAALVLPISALENPLVAEQTPLIIRDPESQLAIEGFDPVGYFTEGEALRGDPAFRAEHEGAVFYFASAEHRDAFLETPRKFIPAYGGYCTETLAMGSLTPASPLHWTIHGDRLFLTRSAKANETFREKRAQSIAAANDSWSQVHASVDKFNFRAHAPEGL